MKHNIAVYHCHEAIEGPCTQETVSARAVADVVFQAMQRSLLNETDLLALDEWMMGDGIYHVYFVVANADWFACHREEILRIVAEHFGVPVKQLQNIASLTE